MERERDRQLDKEQRVNLWKQFWMITTKNTNKFHPAAAEYIPIDFIIKLRLNRMSLFHIQSFLRFYNEALYAC